MQRYLSDFLSACAIALFLIPSAVLAEEITVTTYYPSPNGNYSGLLAEEMAIGDMDSDGTVNASDLPAAYNLAVKGNVGIGTRTPNAKLTISNNVANAFLDNYTEYQQILYDGGSASGSYGFGIKGNTMVFNSGAGAYSFDAGASATRLAIDTSGNVGIGTTTPSYPLNLYKAASETGILLSWGANSVYLSHGGWSMGAGKFGIGNGATPSIVVDSINNNVGIGTTTPNANMKLQAAGEICSSTLGPAGGNIRMIAGSYGCFIRNDGANTYFLLTDPGNQYGGWNGLRPLYINNASGYVTFGSGHGDLAESYLISGKALRGSLMSVDSAAPSTAIKADPLRPSLLGVISTTPGAVMDTDGGFHIGYGTKGEYKDEKAPVVLVGAAPVLVSSQNGSISIGDPVGMSSIPGFGAKPAAAGLIVGRALEAFNTSPAVCKTAASIDTIKWPEDNGKNSKKPCFKLPDGTYVGKIMVAVNVSWYDPSAKYTDPNKELIKEMGTNITDLIREGKAQQQEIRALKQEIDELKSSLKKIGE